MNSQSEDKKNLVEKEHQSAEFNSSRRKLTKAGIISPVIMSLSSKPVFAQATCTQSGMLSGNVSLNYDAQCDKPGLSRQYYIDEINAGRAICATPEGPDLSAVKFLSIFDPNGAYPEIYSTLATLADVITGVEAIIVPQGIGNFFCDTDANGQNASAEKSAYLAALSEAAKEAVAALFNFWILPWYKTNAELDGVVIAGESIIIDGFYTNSGLTKDKNQKQNCTDLTRELTSFVDNLAINNNT